MAELPFDRQKVRELARVYARIAVDLLLTEAQTHATNGKAPRSERAAKKTKESTREEKEHKNPRAPKRRGR